MKLEKLEKLEKLKKLEPIAFLPSIYLQKNNPLPSLKCPQRGGEESFVYFSRCLAYSQAASRKAPVPKFVTLFWFTTCPGIAFSPIGCT